MAITEELAMEKKDSYAITCCRFEEGTVISPSNIEDPNLIPDLEDSGLITIPENCLKIGEALGATLTKTLDALTPITTDVVEGITKMESQELEETEEVEEVVEEPVEQTNVTQTAPSFNNGNIKIQIGEGKDINIEIPFPTIGQNQPISQQAQVIDENIETEFEKKTDEKELRKLTKKYFKIDKVEFAEGTKIEGNTLYIRKDITDDAVNSQDLVVDMGIDFMTSDRYDEFSNTIMDIQIGRASCRERV